jgi:pre-mRNA-splicing factor CWC22
MNIAKGYEHELVDMILECCMMERIYQSFFGLLAERFCTYEDKFKDLFERAFLSHYNNIFNQDANKIRNLAHLFGHLFHRRAVDWAILQPIRLSPEATTAAARMFLKILLRDIAENMGAENLAK